MTHRPFLLHSLDAGLQASQALARDPAPLAEAPGTQKVPAGAPANRSTDAGPGRGATAEVAPVADPVETFARSGSARWPGSWRWRGLDRRAR